MKATVISCKDIFISLNDIPPNVDVCYRVVITVTIEVRSKAETKQLVDEIDYSVEYGTFTEDLQFLVVLE